MDRQNRLLTILSIVFLVLVVVVVLGKDDQERTSPASEDGPARHDLFDYQNADIRQVALKSASGELVFDKSDGSWKMTAPRQMPVDERKVDEIVERFGTLEVEEREVKGDPAQLGLDDAQQVEVVLTDSNGKVFRAWLGKDTQVGYATYIRETTSGPVHLATSKVGDLLKRTADDFRAREVWDVSTATARKVEIEAGDRSVVLRRDAHGWWVGDNGPRADQERIDDWFREAADLRIATFRDEATPASVGLEPPAARIAVEGDERTDSLALGPTGDTAIPALVGGGVVELGPEAAGLVKLDGWASTRLVPVRKFQVDRLEVKLGDRALSLTRKEGRWSDAAGAASEAGDGMLQALSEATADWGATGVPAPTEAWGRIELAEGTDRKEVVLIGQDLGNGTRAARDEAGGPPFAVPVATLEALAAKLP